MKKKDEVPYYSSALHGIRLQAGVTSQIEWAARLGVSQATVTRIETGVRVPSAKLLKEWVTLGNQEEMLGVIESDILATCGGSQIAKKYPEKEKRFRLLVSSTVDEIADIIADDTGQVHRVIVSKQSRLKLRDTVEALALKVLGCQKKKTD